jgi:hypothetical protein
MYGRKMPVPFFALPETRRYFFNSKISLLQLRWWTALLQPFMMLRYFYGVHPLHTVFTFLVDK